jgi:hypothetical protein
MSKIKTEGYPENRKRKRPVGIANISSLTAAKLFQLAAQLEILSSEQNRVTPQYGVPYPRFE